MAKKPSIAPKQTKVVPVDGTVEPGIDEVEVMAGESTGQVEIDGKIPEIQKVVEEGTEIEVTHFTPGDSNRPKENVKIRLRKDHSCCIAMEQYDFKEGKVYTVPKNVKRILNRAGLLSPL